MTEKFFLEVVLLLVACLLGLLAFIWNTHMKQHHEINLILKQLLEVKPICTATFAKQADVANIDGRLSAIESLK